MVMHWEESNFYAAEWTIIYLYLYKLMKWKKKLMKQFSRQLGILFICICLRSFIVSARRVYKRFPQESSDVWLIFQVRTIIISLCTIIPLAPYRKAATQLICRKRNTQTSQSMEVTMAVNCLNSRRRCTFIAPSREAFGIDATLTQVEAYPYARWAFRHHI